MVRGIIIERKNIAGISYPRVKKEDSHPRIVLKNGEILDRWLTLDFRNFDFSGRLFSFGYDINGDEIFGIHNQCAFLKTCKIDGGSEVIEDMIYTDNDILEELLK